MTEPPRPAAGTIAGFDLTVPDAGALRDFYASVVGWTPIEVAMGDYADYAMTTPGGEWVAGVCHQRGANADLPPQWLVYVAVDDLESRLERVRALGGTQLTPIKGSGGKGPRYAVIRDPAGAVLALLEPPGAAG
jgi:predicted enzyme related to lactoylglutathione lyase